MYLTGLKFRIRYYDHAIRRWNEATPPYKVRYTYNGSTMEIGTWINPNGKFAELAYNIDPLLVYLLTKHAANGINYENAATFVSSAGRHSSEDVYRGHSDRGMYLSGLLKIDWENAHVYTAYMSFEELSRLSDPLQANISFEQFSSYMYRRSLGRDLACTPQDMLDATVAFLSAEEYSSDLYYDVADLRMRVIDRSRDPIDTALFVEFLKSLRIDGEQFSAHDIVVSISPVSHSTNRRLEHLLLDTQPCVVKIDDEVQ
jgi:hypothetical protein